MVETHQRTQAGEYESESLMTAMTVSGRRFDLDAQRVEEALQGELPEPVQEHFVVINGRRWPPKQVLARVTGLDRADFTTHQARRALTRLGFPAGRAARSRGRHPTARSAAAARTASACEELRPFIGQWVAVRDDEVLVAAPSPRDVVAWLARHGERAQAMFRVVDTDQAVTGAAPR
jgi:hypothetical protein